MLTEGMFLVDRYEILTKVGAGGMSDVYKAKDHILGRTVAVKVLKAEFSEDINFVTKFRTEAQSAAGLEHPNIVNIYDVGSEKGLHFIVMEYVEGITLKTYIEKKGQLAFKEATSIAIQVARGIEAAHNKNITHRDIKPQNIIISTDGKVKVTDFGIAKAISSNTISSDAMGSVHYASPEQARNGFIDGRSDIYSLGIVMYEMVTGRVPFDGDTTVAVAIQHLQEEMVEPSAYAPELPISYEKIILKATQKSPERRYQTVAELLKDLRQALITPNEDFVVIVPPVIGDTRVINGEELEAIQSSAEGTDLNKENGFASAEGKNADVETENVDDEEIDDEENEDASGFLDPKMEKVVTIGGIVIGIAIVAIIAFIVGKMVFNQIKFGGEDTESQQTEQSEDSETEEADEDENKVEMISLSGMDVDEAEDALEKLGLELNVVAYKESSEADGTILEQSEAKGNMVKKGSAISVVVSGTNVSVESIEVPTVVGAEEADAYNKLTAKGFLVTKQYENSSTVAKGKVISQTPSAGNKASKGTRVTIVISEGAATKTVPADLVGKSKSNAQSKLEDLGFVVKFVEAKSDDYPEAGTVISVAGAGTQKEVGTTIEVTVSSGPKTEKPTTYSFDKTYDNAEATSYKYVLKDANGKTISSGDGNGNKVRINATGISTSSGTLTIEWYKEVTTTTEVTTDEDADGDGNLDVKEETTTSTEKISTTDTSVSFDEE